MLRPVSNAANGMQRLLNDPRDLAAALPLVATKAAANTGTVSVAELQITTMPLPTPGARAQITFTNDAGDYSWDLLDAGNAVLSSGAGTWWNGIETKLTRARNLSVWRLPAEQSAELARLAQRGMQLQVTVQDGAIWVGDASRSVEIQPQRLMGAAA